MAIEEQYLCLMDFNRELSDLDVLRERLVSLGLDCDAFSIERSATGTVMVKVRASYGVEWLRILSEIEEVTKSIN